MKNKGVEEVKRLAEEIERDVKRFLADLSRDCIENNGDEDPEEFPMPNRLLKYIEKQIDKEKREITKLETLKKIIIGVGELCDRLEHLDGFRYRQLSFEDLIRDSVNLGIEKKNAGETIVSKEDIRGSLDKLKTAIEEISFFSEEGIDWNWGQIKICKELKTALYDLRNGYLRET